MKKKRDFKYIIIIGVLAATGWFLFQQKPDVRSTTGTHTDGEYRLWVEVNANRWTIENREQFAEKLLKMMDENTFQKVHFSEDLEEPHCIIFRVYLMPYHSNWAFEVCCGKQKNVKGVKVPNSGGMKGVEAAAVLGLAGGDPSQALEVLEAVTQTDIKRTKELLRGSFCDCCLKEGVANLYIEVQVVNGENEATVIIEQEHTNITRIEKNGKIVYAHKKEVSGEEIEVDKSLLNLADILVFAQEVDLNEVRDVLARQIRYNSRIAKEGLEHEWGAQVGRVIAEEFGTTVQWKAVASAAAGSDARMSGCSLPVIINSGSGNQGMTCSLPVIEYGKELKKSEEEIYRALCVSNLVALNQKRYIGSLSAYCGAVCAAAGAGAGITYLCGGNLEQIQNTVVNTIADAGGIVCDGAKPSCAAKIATSLQAAILSHKMAMRGLVFGSGEGLVMDCPEDTIKAVGYVGRAGMKQTDVEILNLMIGKTKIEDIEK